MFERIVYVSRAAPGITSREVYDIVRVSHNRNSQHGLTGGLLFIDDHFVQVIEGDQLRVRERLKIISGDPRHAHLDLRQAVASNTLIFPNEWLALRDGSLIAAGIKSAFGYAPGLPADRFDGDRIVAFVLACCRLPTQARTSFATLAQPAAGASGDDSMTVVAPVSAPSNPTRL
jgi:hypothetical protein